MNGDPPKFSMWSRANITIPLLVSVRIGFTMTYDIKPLFFFSVHQLQASSCMYVCSIAMNVLQLPCKLWECEIGKQEIRRSRSNSWSGLFKTILARRVNLEAYWSLKNLNLKLENLKLETLFFFRDRSPDPLKNLGNFAIEAWIPLIPYAFLMENIESLTWVKMGMPREQRCIVSNLTYYVTDKHRRWVAHQPH